MKNHQTKEEKKKKDKNDGPYKPDVDDINTTLEKNKRHKMSLTMFGRLVHIGSYGSLADVADVKEAVVEKLSSTKYVTYEELYDVFSEFRREFAIRILRAKGCLLKTDSHKCNADECNQALSVTKFFDNEYRNFLFTRFIGCIFEILFVFINQIVVTFSSKMILLSWSKKDVAVCRFEEMKFFLLFEGLSFSYGIF